MSNVKITLKMLEDKGACDYQRVLFRELFGESVDVTPELCESLAEKFDFGWAAEHLLSPSAWAEFQRVTAPAWDEYQRARAFARADRRVTAPSWDEFERVTAPAYHRVRASEEDKYRRASSSAWVKFERVRARAFGELLSPSATHSQKAGL